MTLVTVVIEVILTKVVAKVTLVRTVTVVTALKVVKVVTLMAVVAVSTVVTVATPVKVMEEVTEVRVVIFVTISTVVIVMKDQALLGVNWKIYSHKSWEYIFQYTLSRAWSILENTAQATRTTRRIISSNISLQGRTILEFQLRMSVL